MGIKSVGNILGLVGRWNNYGKWRKSRRLRRWACQVRDYGGKVMKKRRLLRVSGN